MDDKWRILSCPICRGYGIVSAPMAWFGFTECDNCGESGTIWLRPKGHSFAYPGGPATGMWGIEYYKKGTPQMPYEWHCWTNSDKEVDDFIVDRSGSFDQDLNIVTCACGFTGSLRKHEEHAEEERIKFVEDRIINK